MINGITPLLVFEKRSYVPKYEIHRTEKAVHLNAINSIKVMCNLVQGSIYEFFPSEVTGTK